MKEEAIVFNAIVLDAESRELLKEKFPGIHEKYFSDHITLNYGKQEFPKNLGDSIEFKVVGYISDDRAEGVIVEGVETENAVAHITISTAQKVPPKYTNELLEREYENIDPFSLKGRVCTYIKYYGYLTELDEVNYSTVYIPTRPQLDTLVAYYLLRTYGTSVFWGINDSHIEIQSRIEESPQDLARKGTLLLDCGSSVFDHHVHGETASRLVAKYLNILDDPSIEKMISVAERDDKEGKGTISQDMLDKAFGISGLISALNKSLPEEPDTVARIILPLLWGHHTEEKARTLEIPREFEELKKSGSVLVEEKVKHKKSKLLVVALASDNISLPGWLRSTQGIRADVVIQKRSSGHINILTRPLKRVDLRLVTAYIRNTELEKAGKSMQDIGAMMQEGIVDEVPRWYYDTATNSLLNGGMDTENVKPTSLSLKEVFDTTIRGLEELNIRKNK